MLTFRGWLIYVWFDSIKQYYKICSFSGVLSNSIDFKEIDMLSMRRIRLNCRSKLFLASNYQSAIMYQVLINKKELQI